jgi:formate dehydrogenase iron-sulfur subunit
MAASSFSTIESCGKCTPCRIGATRGVEVVDRLLAGVKTAENIALLEDLAPGSLAAAGYLRSLIVVGATAMIRYAREEGPVRSPPITPA